MIFSKVQFGHCAYVFRKNEKNIVERKQCVLFNQY